MKTRVLATPREVARAGAEAVERALAAIAGRPSVVGLPTGRTALALYDEIAGRRQTGRRGLEGIDGFNLDELVLPAAHPASFVSFMRRHAYGRTGLDPARCDVPDGTADDLEAEARRYDGAVAAAGGLDLAILGIGADGHVAYNLPGPPRAGTHVVRLPDSLADSLEVPDRWRPLRAVTLGMAALEGAGSVLMLASGERKAAAVAALLDGPADPAWPCSLLRGHPALEVVVDRAAASASTAGSQLAGSALAAVGEDAGG